MPSEFTAHLDKGGWMKIAWKATACHVLLPNLLCVALESLDHLMNPDHKVVPFTGEIGELEGDRWAHLHVATLCDRVGFLTNQLVDPQYAHGRRIIVNPLGTWPRE
jgi:hypothetical protein